MSQRLTRRRLSPADWSAVAGAELVTITEAAQRAGVTPKLVREWVQRGHVPYAVLSGRIVVPDVAVIRRERDARHYRRRAGGRRRSAD